MTQIHPLDALEASLRTGEQTILNGVWASALKGTVAPMPAPTTLDPTPTPAAQRTYERLDVDDHRAISHALRDAARIVAAAGLPAEYRDAAFRMVASELMAPALPRTGRFDRRTPDPR